MNLLPLEAGPWTTEIIGAERGDESPRGELETFRNFLNDRPDRGLAFLLTDQTPSSIARLLLLLAARIPFVLLDEKMDAARLKDLVEIYRPNLMILPSTSPGEVPGFAKVRSIDGVGWRKVSSPPAHRELAVLLTTSGSTGTPKLVRLSYDNVVTNARQIISSLTIVQTDRPITCLPLHYSFGMSVVTSHALAGAPLIATQASPVTKEFWEIVEQHKATFISGVPQSLAMLKRLGFRERAGPSVQVLVQAGGKLPDALVEYFATTMRIRGGRFHTMYGQTEASPRITCLPANHSSEKSASVGLPMPGGNIRIVGDDGTEVKLGEVGEVEYTGPNVMMGYAMSRHDLELGDTHGNVLRTGDYGYVDSDGFLYLVGRRDRYAKVSGIRVSLDEVQDRVSALLVHQVAVTSDSKDGINIFMPEECRRDLLETRRIIARDLRISSSLIHPYRIPDIPLLSNGKVNFTKLAEIGEEFS